MNCVGGETHNVFVYGSLLADEVVHTLLKRLPPTTPAILHDQLLSLSLCNSFKSHFIPFIFTTNDFPLSLNWYLICSHRFKIKGRVYPAILPVHNDKVNGRVCLSFCTSLLNIHPSISLSLKQNHFHSHFS